ncbi:tol-pal system-associated acyl-CoA thioesterase [Sphingomonadaceae bacterium G21617-S1]|jgi:acyl-CoA thioester hydrolase|uniref:tol-pal system-associated acyl-CoA thioesterase n=1 Tax=Rhizorhabdus sp. TaxID=1968843 RepID=UPI0012246CA9|nr:tol-pal system-associated acyl-CoA thioesterase [Rhizorhabdus sp.]MBD3762308.1 tol-pal system-associated acyl-CoA thioesterase [Rhizorhabdus sp.]MCZ4343533.1 tol-pal system-associated acyl-CoA thioesterase [Sphingomonadaceae bacterium G21617-S1]TAK10501.1 MAG: tol-pal system-associated acyl-CoA thioesterase [Rhizorhabdus sp.]
MPETPYSGRFAAGEHLFAIRVYFEDTDAGGVVYHASYLRFMERARSDMMRLAGVDQRGAMERGDGNYVVYAMALRFRAPARLDDALVVRSRVGNMKGAQCVVHQRVMRGSETVIEAEVSVALIGPDGRPKRQPRAWIETFERLKTED